MKKIVVKLLVAGLLVTSFNGFGLLSLPKASASEVGLPVTVRAEADTYVDSANPEHVGQYVIDSSTGLPRPFAQFRVTEFQTSYLRFDFNQGNLEDISKVSDAMLKLAHSATVAPETVTHDVYMVMDDSWDVDTMSYSTRPTGEEKYLGSFFVSSVKNTRFDAIDLAPWVNEALADDDDRKVTLRISLSPTSIAKSGVWYASDENYWRPNLIVTPSELREPPPPPPVEMPDVPLEPVYSARYEAESQFDAVISPGAVDAGWPGFSGDGFANTANVAGAYVEWTFHMEEPGNKYLGIIYAQHAGANRTAELHVNSELITELPFQDTTRWDYWQYQVFSSYLKAGENKVRITAKVGEGLANIDALDVIGGPFPEPLPPPPPETPPLPYPPLGPAPEPAPIGSTIQVGNTDVLGDSEATTADHTEMNRITVHQTAEIKELSVFVESGEGNMRLALYGDDSGKPGTLIAKTEDFTAVSGWNTHPVNWQVQLLPTEDYWIGYQTDGDEVVVRTEPTGGNHFSYLIGYANGIPKSLEGRYKTETTKRTSIYASLKTVNPISVFPGVGGFGVYTQGGRYGEIIKVTNLNDRGPGSLRDAVAAEGPRTVVFEVSGNVELTGSIIVTNPYLTIAGQTAPSPGITLKGAGIRVATHDVFIQHIRARIGDGPLGDTYEDRDIFQIVGDDKVHDVVIDRISGSWSLDETISTWDIYGADDVEARRKGLRNITISNSMIGEPLSSNLHPKGGHPFGLLVGDDSKHVAVIGNFQAHVAQRAPLIKAGSTAYVANNVWYDVARPATNVYGDYGGAYANPALISYIGNNWVKGPHTEYDYIVYMHSYPPDDPNRFEWYAGTKVFFDDNVHYGEKFWIDPGYTERWGHTEYGVNGEANPFVDTPPVVADNFTPLSPQESEQRVIAYAGARASDRDAVDIRLLEQYRTRTGTIPKTMAEVGGWPELAVNYREFVAPANPHGDDDGDGYTNLEELLHEMAFEAETGFSVNEDGSVTVPVEPSIDATTNEPSVTLDEYVYNRALEIATAFGSDVVRLEVANAEGAARYQVALPIAALASGSDTRIVIATEFGTVEALSSMLTPTEAEGKDFVALNLFASEEVRGKKAAVIGLTLASEGEPMEWRNREAPLQVTVPYTPTFNELKHPGHINVFFEDGTGMLRPAKGAYDASSSSLTFEIERFSK